jgi:hypothetical protein
MSGQVKGPFKLETIIIGEEPFSVGMAQQEAMKSLEKCCFIKGGTEGFFIWKKDKTETLGGIWFRAGKVERLVRDVKLSQNPETVSFALSLYRMLLEMTHSNPATIVLQTDAIEALNGSAKLLTLTFTTGRSIRIQLDALDDAGEAGNQVTLKEILEER